MIDDWRRFRTAFLWAGFVVGILVLVIGVLPALAPADPYAQVLEEKLSPPALDHWLGTDDLGRDVLSRVLYGGRISGIVSLLAVALSLMIGVPIGAISGYVGGYLDMAMMRVVDILMAFPAILLAVTVVAILGPSLPNVVIAIGVVGIPTIARQTRAGVISVKEELYVEACRALGALPRRILFRSVLPNAMTPLFVLATFGMGTAILDTAGLSFLGLGAEPGTPEWGTIIADGRKLFLSAPWAIISPGVAIFLYVFTFNRIGEAVRRRFLSRSVSPDWEASSR